MNGDTDRFGTGFLFGGVRAFTIENVAPVVYFIAKQDCRGGGVGKTCSPPGKKEWQVWLSQEF
jgi:hypothetical protein